MPRGKKELAEQIIPKLREVEVEVGRGKTVAESVKKIGAEVGTGCHVADDGSCAWLSLHRRAEHPNQPSMHT